MFSEKPSLVETFAEFGIGRKLWILWLYALLLPLVSTVYLIF